MSLFVVDARVVAKWFVPERHSDDAARLLDDQHELASPDLMWSEIDNVLWKKSRVTADERFGNALADGPLGRHVLWLGMPGRFN